MFLPPAAVRAVCGGAGELRQAVGGVLRPGRPAGRAAVPEEGPGPEREVGPRGGQGAVNHPLEDESVPEKGDWICIVCSPLRARFR